MIEIMDTTLRDGEQMNNVSYSKEEKHIIGKILLEKVKVDRLEYTSALISQNEKVSTKEFIEKLDDSLKKKVEILGFLNQKSIDWLKDINAYNINLLAKGSLNHLKQDSVLIMCLSISSSSIAFSNKGIISSYRSFKA